MEQPDHSPDCPLTHKLIGPIEITAEQIKSLVLAGIDPQNRKNRIPGAGILEFQIFLGGNEQIYRTTVILANAIFVTYHKKIFPFTHQSNGKIILDDDRAVLPSSHPGELRK